MSPRSQAANRWDLARPHIGGMLTVGVGGSPIGRGADLLAVIHALIAADSAAEVERRARAFAALFQAS